MCKNTWKTTESLNTVPKLNSSSQLDRRKHSHSPCRPENPFPERKSTSNVRTFQEFQDHCESHSLIKILFYWEPCSKFKRTGLQQP